MPWRLLWIGILWQLYNGDFDAAGDQKEGGERRQNCQFIFIDEGYDHCRLRDCTN